MRTWKPPSEAFVSKLDRLGLSEEEYRALRDQAERDELEALAEEFVR